MSLMTIFSTISRPRQSPLGPVLAALGFSLGLAGPAAADHWGGQPGMGWGQPACQAQPQGPGECPRMQARPGAVPMAGKALGVYVRDLPNAVLDAAEPGYGVNVEKVREQSAAAAAGIRAGDLIVEFAGKPVLSGERLRWLVGRAETGKAQEVKLLREGRPVTVQVTLPAPEAKPKCDPAPRVGA